MDNRIVLGVISVFVVLAVIGSALTPMIDAYTTTTTTVENEGAVGLRMDKVTSGDFTLNYGLVGDDFTATNGTDTQIINDMCIFYADDNFAVWMDDSSVRMVGKDANDQTIDAALSDEATITITKSADGVNITDGTVDKTFPVPAWSYVPKSTGAYGFFLNETEVNTAGLDVHYVGSFAGVNCYDSINSFDLPLALDATINESTLTGAKWIKAEDPATELTPLDPGSLTPLDPSVIDLDTEPDTSIMTVPTPTYTDGDWGYDLITSGEGIGKAKIVSYSGTGGDIVVPATVGGYEVYQFGKGAGSYDNVFDYSSLPATNTIKFPDGLKVIAIGCMYNQGAKWTGDLIIPDSVVTIGKEAFTYLRAFESLKLSDNLTSVGQASFQGLKVETPLIIPASLTTIGVIAFADGLWNGLILMGTPSSINTNSFRGNTSLKEVLNFGELELTTTSYGLNADEVRSDIPALGYLAAAQYSETVTDDSPMAALLKVIPLITIIAVVTMAIGLFIARRME